MTETNECAVAQAVYIDEREALSTISADDNEEREGNVRLRERQIDGSFSKRVEREEDAELDERIGHGYESSESMRECEDECVN